MWDKVLGLLGGNLFTGVAEIVGKFVTDPTKAAELQAELAKLEAATKVQLEGLAVQDRNSARQREMAVKDGTPAILAYVITAGFFGILAWMLVRPIPEQGHDALMILLGSLGTAWVAIVSYYYGSSAGQDNAARKL